VTTTAPEPIITRYDSAWSASVSVTTAPDETAPPVPSVPQRTSSGGALRLLWNGLGQFGEAMPPDLDAVEAHLSTAASYTPTGPAARAAPGFTLANDTYRGDLVAGVPATIAGLATGTNYYLIVVARDRAGNRSAPSAPVAV
jgi:hypothetical protein